MTYAPYRIVIAKPGPIALTRIWVTVVQRIEPVRNATQPNTSPMNAVPNQNAAGRPPVGAGRAEELPDTADAEQSDRKRDTPDQPEESEAEQVAPSRAEGVDAGAKHQVRGEDQHRRGGEGDQVSSASGCVRIVLDASLRFLGGLRFARA